MNPFAYETAIAIVRHLEAQVAALKAEEAREIAACTANKSPIGEHYWQPRHNAEQRLHAAKALAEALKE